MMNNLQSSAQVAKNFLNVLQGYTKGIRFVAVLTLLLTVAIGQAWGAEEVYKETIFSSSNNSKNISSYSNSWSNTTNSFKVNITNANNNNNGWAYIKMGSSSNASTGTIITASSIDKKITKVSLNIGAITSSYVTSIKLYKSTNNSTWVEIGSFSKSTNWQNVVISDANQGTNLYYKIEAVCKKANKNGPLQINGVRFYIEDTPVQSHTVNWTINPIEGGSLSATSGNTTTVTPNAAYTYGDPAHTVTSGTATVSQNDNTFSAVPTANCTIQINMVEKPKYTVNWHVNCTIEHTQTDVAGTTLTNIPTPTTADCDNSKVFVGWTIQPSYEHATNAPTDLITNTTGMKIPESGEDYYAVFAEASGDGEEGWQKVTSTDQVKDGEIYTFISFDDAYYLANAQSTSDPIVKAVSKTNGILNVTNEMKWIASANSGGFEFKSYSNNNYYLWGGSANDAIRINTTSTKANATKVWYTKILNTYGVVIYHNASTDGAKYLATNGSSNWRNYLDNNTLGNTNRVANLYKFTSGTTYSNYTTQCSTQTVSCLHANAQTSKVIFDILI